MITDSYEAANKFIQKPRRIKSRQKERKVVEAWNISSDSEKENGDELVQSELGTDDLVNRLRIKQEQNNVLQSTVKKLNSRLGTEIIDDNENGSSSLVCYENSKNINTLTYQRDAEFGSSFYFITNVKFISIQTILLSI